MPVSALITSTFCYKITNRRQFHYVTHATCFQHTCKIKLIVDFHNFAKAPYLKMFLRNGKDFSTQVSSCTSMHIFRTEENLQLKNAYFTEVVSEQPAGLYR